MYHSISLGPEEMRALPTVIHNNVKQENDRLRLHNTIRRVKLLLELRDVDIRNTDDVKTVCQFRK